MIPIKNRPMLEHLLCSVRDSGIHEFVIVVGYQEHAIRDHFKDGREFGVTIQYARQAHQAGTADALLTAKPYVHGSFLMVNGDMLLLEEDITKIWQSPAPTLGICAVSDPSMYGVVTVEEQRNNDIFSFFVTSFEEKSQEPSSPLINCGAYHFNPEIFEELARITPSPRGELELVDALIPAIISRKLRAVHMESWRDLGSPWDLLDANAAMLEHAMDDGGDIRCYQDIAPDAVIEEGVWLHGSVIIGSGTVIKSGTYIEGPCIIGNNAKIGPHTYIRGATAIGDNCHIGHSTEIKNSIIFSNTNLPHFNYIGDTVVGFGCNFGAGTKVANLRHDKSSIKIGGTDTGRKKFGAVIGDNVLFGINCSVNVGSRIGNYCTFAPGSRIQGDISDKSMYRD
jgi:bifunctional UDP-N-acetylglucosamine pyrophosphorylase/glucosamine-1-phosphate N-acetyltransferase